VLARINTHLTIKLQREQLNVLNATKDRFFSIIAHDLRGPFTGLLGALGMLRDSRADMNEEETNELIVNLYETSERTYHLLENLLEWARSQQQAVRPVPRPLSLIALARETIDLFYASAGQKEIEIILDMPDDLAGYADANMITTALRNLVNNAIKFTSSGGKVTISGTSRDELVEISVIDTGVGIEPDELSTVFSLTRHRSRAGTNGEKGSGLGLILAKDYVTRNRGRIEVHSKPGEGSTFTIFIPAAPTETVSSG
jgi:signal transduction histidine kinase